MSSVIAVVFSEDKEEVLLVKRRDVPVWTLPGGGVEKGEHPEEAILREIKEETGLTISIVKEVGEYSPINRLSCFTHLYECKSIGGDLSLSLETADVKFFNLKDLPLMPPPYEEWIGDAKKNLPHLIRKKLSGVSYLNLFKNFILHPVLVVRFLLSKTIFRINS